MTTSDKSLLKPTRITAQLYRIKRLFRKCFTRRLGYALLVVLALLMLVRGLLPTTVQWYVNRQLDASNFYSGRVGDVDLALFRGAYRIEDVTISKLDGAVPVPLFAADKVEFSLRWDRLIHGEVVAEVAFYQAEINIVDSQQDSGDQTGENTNWVSMLDNLVPIQIDLITVTESEFHFRNFDAEEPVDVVISQVNGSVADLSNRPQMDTDLPSSIQGSGVIMTSGRVELEAQFNANRELPAFNLDARISNVPIIELDSLIKAYAPFDVESGELTLTTELAASDGDITGYFKPLILDLEIFEWKEDALVDQDNPFILLWEALVDLTSEILENQPKDRLATLIPVSGKLDNPETDSWTAFVNILRNAFVEAFGVEFENTVSAEQAEAQDN